MPSKGGVLKRRLKKENGADMWRRRVKVQKASSCQEGISGTSQSIFPFPQKFNSSPNSPAPHSTLPPKSPQLGFDQNTSKFIRTRFELVEFDEEFVGGKKTETET